MIFILPFAGQGQTPLYSQYMFNGLAINPAYAGSHEALAVTGSVRKQWVGLNGAPVTHTLTAHTPVNKKNIAAGLMLRGDYTGATTATMLKGFYVYRITLKDESKLALGLSAGINHSKTRFTDLSLKDSDDPVYRSNALRYNWAEFGTGLYYYSQRGYVGLAIPEVLTSKLTSGNNDFKEPYKYMFLTGAYRFYITPFVDFQPGTLVRVSNSGMVQVDFNTMVSIEKVLDVGLSYRSSSTLVFITKVKLSRQMELGYSYDASLATLKYLGKAGHEFVLTYNFKYYSDNIQSPIDF
ncbi:MAG TPA: PorP/SprF family type IX secretion system membrane protein [Cytophagaceae bacterium]